MTATSGRPRPKMPAWGVTCRRLFRSPHTQAKAKTQRHERLMPTLCSRLLHCVCLLCCKLLTFLQKLLLCKLLYFREVLLKGVLCTAAGERLPVQSEACEQEQTACRLMLRRTAGWSKLLGRSDCGVEQVGSLCKCLRVQMTRCKVAKANGFSTAKLRGFCSGQSRLSRLTRQLLQVCKAQQSTKIFYRNE